MARGPNQKAVAAAEKKAANQATKDAEKARQNAAKEAEEWKKGSNTRAASKAEEAGEPLPISTWIYFQLQENHLTSRL